MATIEATGISFALTDEQKALRGLAHDFAANEIRPKEREYDERMQHPADVVAKAHALGLMNLHVPEEYGGPGLSVFDGQSQISATPFKEHRKEIGPDQLKKLEAIKKDLLDGKITVLDS